MTDVGLRLTTHQACGRLSRGHGGCLPLYYGATVMLALTV